jgi:hypothetical protein
VGDRVTRAELAANLGAQLGLPVAVDDLAAVIPPALILEDGSPWRARTTTCWVKTWDVVVVAGRMDDDHVHDTMDELGDTFCRLVQLQGISHGGASSAPAARSIGGVDHLAVTFELTDYNLGPGSCP